MLVNLICDLLEIVFHHILFIKNVYPEPSFHKKQKYNIPTWKCKHPEVCLYIKNFIDLAKKILESQKALSVILTIRGEDDTCIEEFVFKTHLVEKEAKCNLAKWSMEDMLTSLCVSVNITDPSEKEKIGNNIRKFLGESFELKMMTNSKALTVDGVKSDLKNKDFPWNVMRKSKFNLWTRILPVNTVDNEDYMMQIYRKWK